MPVTIVRDTREQLPYEFQTSTEPGTLATGDYSIKGAEGLVAIERKNLEDLIGCLTTGRDRFERELARAKCLERFVVVVEASFADIVTGNFRSQMDRGAAVQSIMAFWMRYGTPFLFAGCRSLGQLATESLLLKWAREQEKRFNAIGGAA